MTTRSQNGVIRQLVLVVICTGILPAADVRAFQGPPDVAAEYDLSGHAGITFTSWFSGGFSYGFLLPIRKPEAAKVDFHSATAENVMNATFLGYTRERLIGVHAGFSRYLGYTDLVAYLGVGVRYGKRYRRYHDEDGSLGWQDFYVRDRARTRLLLDCEAALSWRDDELIIGLGARLATRSLFVRVGFPAGG